MTNYRIWLIVLFASGLSFLGGFGLASSEFRAKEFGAVDLDFFRQDVLEDFPNPPDPAKLTPAKRIELLQLVTELNGFAIASRKWAAEISCSDPDPKVRREAIGILAGAFRLYHEPESVKIIERCFAEESDLQIREQKKQLLNFFERSKGADSKVLGSG